MSILINHSSELRIGVILKIVLLAVLVFGSANSTKKIELFTDPAQILTGNAFPALKTVVNENSKHIIVGVIAQPPTKPLLKEIKEQVKASKEHEKGSKDKDKEGSKDKEKSSKDKEKKSKDKHKDDKTSVHPSIDLTANEEAGVTFFPMSYTKWAKNGRNNVIFVPIDTNEPIESLKELAKHLGGLILPGGKTSLFTGSDEEEEEGDDEAGSSKKKKKEKKDKQEETQKKDKKDKKKDKVDEVVKEASPYAKTVTELIKVIKARMDAKSGLKIPVFGTCLGFQTLLMAEHFDPKLLKQIGNVAHPGALKLNPDNSVPNYIKTKLNADQIKAIETGSVYYYNHNFAVLEESFKGQAALNAAFNVLGTSVSKFAASKDPEHADPKYKSNFVAAIAHKQYPIFGVQFHPEKNEYEKHLSLSAKPEEKPLLDVFANNFFEVANSFATVDDVTYLEGYFANFKTFKMTGYATFDEILLVTRKKARLAII